jgi:hypothetical protein
MKRKRPPICDETDGLVETASMNLVLITCNHLLMIRDSKRKFSHARKREREGNPAPIKKYIDYS